MLTEQNIGGYITLKAVRRNVGGCAIVAESFDGKQTLVTEYPTIEGRKIAFQKAVRDGKLRAHIAKLVKQTRERYEWAEQVAEAVAVLEECDAPEDYAVAPDVFPMGV